MRSLLVLCLLGVAIPSNAMAVRSPNSTSTGNAIGATYFITNEPSGNYIVSSAFGPDGKLFTQRAISTGGFGGHNLDVPGADPLFSQGVIETSPLGILAVANPGSDTISVFSISENDPSLLAPLGTPVWSRGEFPVSVAFNKAGDVLCALNTGSLNGISCYNADKAKGLTPIPNATRYLHLNQTSPVSGPFLGSAGQIIFSEDEQLLIVTVKGINATTHAGYLAAWDVYENFTLSQNFNRVALPAGANYPYSVTIIPGGNALLAADPAMGFDVFFNISGNSNRGDQRNIGVGSYAYSIPNQLTTCWSAYSPISQNYYLSDLLENRITIISIDTNLKSTIIDYISLGNDFGPLDVATVVVGGQGFLYVLSTTPKAVDVFSVDELGKVAHIQRFNYIAFARSVGIELDPNYLTGMGVFTWKQ
ncbi:hypothetical protein F5887DRAFT_1021521 [Amanita rubescens]|nr:hypothetical protein F5887DRAFT_1021521 [Amanita rubescens]